MSPTFQKGLLQGIFNSAHHLWSGHGLPRAFSSCGIRAARRTPTEEELSTMSAYQRWYYKKADDPVWRRKRLDNNIPRTEKYFDKMRRTGRYTDYRKQQTVLENARYHQKPVYRFAQNMAKWLLRLSVNSREAFVWKTHSPMTYPEAVRKICSICLSYPARGSRIW